MILRQRRWTGTVSKDEQKRKDGEILVRVLETVCRLNVEKWDTRRVEVAGEVSQVEFCFRPNVGQFSYN